MRAVLIDNEGKLIGEVNVPSRVRAVEMKNRLFVVSSLGLLSDDQIALFQESEAVKIKLDKEFK